MCRTAPLIGRRFPANSFSFRTPSSDRTFASPFPAPSPVRLSMVASTPPNPRVAVIPGPIMPVPMTAAVWSFASGILIF